MNETARGDPIPQVIEWRISGRCNEVCVYCYGPAKSVDPPATVIDEILNRLVDSAVDIVRFSGGEPLICRSIVDVVNRLAAAKKQVVLSTNGINFVRLRPEIESSISKLNLSLDGYDRRTHSLGGRTGIGFDRALGALTALAADPPDYPIKVGTVVTSRNVAEPEILQRMLDLLLTMPVNRWKIYQYVPEGPVLDTTLCVGSSDFAALEESLMQYAAKVLGIRELDIAFSSATARSGAYFIIEPYGDVIVPVGNSEYTEEVRLGNVLSSDIAELFERWTAVADVSNHEANFSLPRLQGER